MTGIALVGLGMVGPIYAEALHGLAQDVEDQVGDQIGGRVSVCGVLASTRDSGQRFYDRFSHWLGDSCTVYADLAEVAADERVDIVIIATPPNARAEIVDELSAAGKHLLMEKPVERTLAAAQAIVTQCEERSVALGIVLQHRARPVAGIVADLQRSGEVGPLAAVEVSFPWWRPQSYYEALGRGTYERDGGGVLITQAIHTLDLMLALTGPVDAVTALTATTALHTTAQNGLESEDFVSAGLEFASGAVGSLFATTAAFPGRTERITFHHTAATIHLVANSVRVEWLDGRTVEHGESAGTGAGADPMAFTADWHRAVIADFVESVREGRPPLVTGRTALGVHRLIDGIERSGKAQRREVIR